MKKSDKREQTAKSTRGNKDLAQKSQAAKSDRGNKDLTQKSRAAKSVRLNKYLAQCGVCSRRDADKLIGDGSVLVNGERAVMGMTVAPEDTVQVGKRILQGPEKKVVLAYYKPVGVTCTERDAHAGKKLPDVIQYPIRVTYAGRLDKDSEGLLLLSNDGDLMESMMRGANYHEKEYVVKVDREITENFLTKMSQGVYLKDLDETTRPCTVRQTGKYTFHILLTQGLNRQIRRMCQANGMQVRSLKRIRVMNIELGELKPGQYRELTADELEKLYALTGRRISKTGNHSEGR